MTDSVSTSLRLNKTIDLSRNDAPVGHEITATDLPFTDTIPADLEGRWLRNGPNPDIDIDPSDHHWFMGNGMLHGVRLRGGRAEWYRNRRVDGGEVTAVAQIDVTEDAQLNGLIGRGRCACDHVRRRTAEPVVADPPTERSKGRGPLVLAQPGRKTARLVSAVTHASARDRSARRGLAPADVSLTGRCHGLLSAHAATHRAPLRPLAEGTATMTPRRSAHTRITARRLAVAGAAASLLVAA
ncbi:MAG: carotenoid oxygenase family protein [Ilumatobacteraceae bacterium]|nr:carotenoid oxygenase family protein [Ilumatobacteraceae bacterium]